MGAAIAMTQAQATSLITYLYQFTSPAAILS
jgi:hypothetical protein